MMASCESSRVAKGVVSQSRGSERLANGGTMWLSDLERLVAQEMALESVAVEVGEALLYQTKLQLASLELLRKPESVNSGRDW